MNIAVSYTYSNLMPDVERHLSVIGKRATTKDGQNIFSKVTLSTAEKPILIQYMQQASQNVVAAIEQFVSAYTEANSGISFNVTNTRWNDPNTPSFVAAFNPAYKKYVVMYTVAEYLSMYFPEFANKYYDAAQQAIQAVIRLMYFKAPVPATEVEPPSSSVTPEVTFYASQIGEGSYEFAVQLSFIINTLSKWNEITITHYHEGEEETSTTISVTQNDGTTNLLPTALSFTGHTVIDADTIVAEDTNILEYLNANADSIGEYVRFKTVTDEKDTLVISWTEQNNNP